MCSPLIAMRHSSDPGQIAHTTARARPDRWARTHARVRARLTHTQGLHEVCQRCTAMYPHVHFVHPQGTCHFRASETTVHCVCWDKPRISTPTHSVSTTQLCGVLRLPGTPDDPATAPAANRGVAPSEGFAGPVLQPSGDGDCSSRVAESETTNEVDPAQARGLSNTSVSPSGCHHWLDGWLIGGSCTSAAPFFCLSTAGR